MFLFVCFDCRVHGSSDGTTHCNQTKSDVHTSNHRRGRKDGQQCVVHSRGISIKLETCEIKTLPFVNRNFDYKSTTIVVIVIIMLASEYICEYIYVCAYLSLINNSASPQCTPL